MSIPSGAVGPRTILASVAMAIILSGACKGAGGADSSAEPAARVLDRLAGILLCRAGLGEGLFAIASPCSAAIRSTTGSRFSRWRPSTATLAPSLANRIAVARPIPSPPPVTRATLSASCICSPP